MLPIVETEKHLNKKKSRLLQLNLLIRLQKKLCVRFVCVVVGELNLYDIVRDEETIIIIGQKIFFWKIHRLIYSSIEEMIPTQKMAIVQRPELGIGVREHISQNQCSKVSLDSQ